MIRFRNRILFYLCAVAVGISSVGLSYAETGVVDVKRLEELTNLNNKIAAEIAKHTSFEDAYKEINGHAPQSKRNNGQAPLEDLMGLVRLNLGAVFTCYEESTDNLDGSVIVASSNQEQLNNPNAIEKDANGTPINKLIIAELKRTHNDEVTIYFEVNTAIPDPKNPGKFLKKQKMALVKGRNALRPGSKYESTKKYFSALIADAQ